MNAVQEAAPEAVTLRALALEGLEILKSEREAFLSGSFERISEIAQRKLGLLERLETLVQRPPPDDRGLLLLERLIQDSRRNEEIIRAARQGLAHARRRIASIKGARRGDVAYEEDGTRISSRADLQSTLKST